jgi:5-methylthioadenosine/S-adenosylhomocysteine deaminase
MALPRKIDTMIFAAWILPVDPSHQRLSGHGIAVDQGKIIDIASVAELKNKYDAHETLDCPHHILMPGLINMHAHSPMVIFRGVGDDKHLMDWLEESIWPAEQACVDESMVYDASKLAMAEMIRSGTTCFNEHYFFPEASVRAIEEVGMRARVGLWAADIETAFGRGIDDYLKAADRSLAANQHKNPLIGFSMAPHAPYTLNDQGFSSVIAMAKEHDLPIHIHLHETVDEIEQSIQNYGKPPIERLDALGLFDQTVHAVHLTQVNDKQIKILAEKQVFVVTCPASNAKLASGFCQVDRLSKAGIKLCLGTDGAASNNQVNMFSELRLMALLGKAVAKDATAVPMEKTLSMATIDAAKAMGWDDRIGSLEIGKEADMILVDTNNLEMQPCHDPYASLVYADPSRHVSHLWVKGRCLLKDGKLQSLDMQDCLSAAADFKAKINKTLSSLPS